MNPSREETAMMQAATNPVNPQVRSSNWAHPEIEALIEIWGQPDILEIFDSNCKNTRAYEAIKARMDALGYQRTVAQVQIKVKNLRQLYRKTTELLTSSATDPASSSSALQVFPFYEKIDSFMSYRQQDFDITSSQDKEQNGEEFANDTKWNMEMGMPHWMEDMQPEQFSMHGMSGMPGCGGEGHVKRKRVHLSIQQKMRIIERLELGESGSKLAAEFGVGKATISDVKRQMEKICEFASSQESAEGLNRRSMRQANDPLLDKALYTWYAQERANGNTPNSAMLRERALAFHRKFNPNGDTEFNASDGWLGRFKARHGIKVGTPRKPRDCQPEGSAGWDVGQTRALLALWSDPDIQTLLSCSSNNDYVYNIIADKMAALGYTCSAAQCRCRMMGLRRQFYRHAARGSTAFMFYDDMVGAMQGAPGPAQLNMQPPAASTAPPPAKRRALDDDDDDDDDADWTNDLVDDGQDARNGDQCEEQESSVLDGSDPSPTDDGPGSPPDTVPTTHLTNVMNAMAKTFSEEYFKCEERKLKLKLEWEAKQKEEQRQWEEAQRKEQRQWEEEQKKEQRQWEEEQKKEQRRWEAAQRGEQRQWEATQREEQRRWEGEQRAAERAERQRRAVQCVCGRTES